MKPYGLARRETCARHIRGTSMNCPCCVPRKQHFNPRALRKRARQQGKAEAMQREAA